MMSDKFYDEFYRQRRNLILISVVLFFALSSGLTLNKVNVWGNEITLKNPDGILTFLWVVWAYWVWRFWVYALEYHQGFFSVLEDIALSAYRNRFEIVYQEKDFYLLEARKSWRGYELVYLPKTPSPNSDKIERINGLEFYIFIAPFFIRLMLSHKSFTDQILPFLIALLPTFFIV